MLLSEGEDDGSIQDTDALIARRKASQVQKKPKFLAD